MLYRIYKALVYLSLPFLAVFILFRALFFKKRAWSTYFLTQVPISTSSCKMWIHAVSLGEVITAKPLITALIDAYSDCQIYLSTMTQTGFQEASKIKGVFPFYLPLDLPFLQKRVISKIQPTLTFYIEGDIWPSMHQELLRAKIPQVLLSAKISEKSFNRLRRYPAIRDLLFSGFNYIWAQDELMKARFTTLEIANACVKELGNLKFAAVKWIQSPPENTRQVDQFLKLDPSKKTVIIASTHHREEGLILEALSKSALSYNLIFVPRHPERFKEVERLLIERQFMPSVLSSPKTQADCFLVDTVGLLNEVLKRGDVVILGGSFVPGIGGHNLMEPLYAKIPVIFGPYMESKLEMRAQILQEHIGAETDLSDLSLLIKKFLDDKDVKNRINGFLDKKQGVLPAYLHEIEAILKKSGNPCS